MRYGYSNLLPVENILPGEQEEGFSSGGTVIGSTEAVSKTQEPTDLAH